MESEKVKEIKKGLGCCKQNEIEDTCKYCLDCPASDWDYEKECKIDLFQKTITLINELESENETIKFNIQETEKASFNINQMNGNLVFENQVLKYRIAELENRLQYTYKQAREEAINDVVQKLKTKFAIRKSFLMLNKDYVGLINIIFDSIYTDLTNIAKEFGVDLRG